MKLTDLTNSNIKFDPEDIENLYNLYQDSDGYYFFNLTRTVIFPEDLNQNTYVEYVIQPKDMWTTISYKFYNTIKLWWLVCSANNIMNPIALPKAGNILKILNNFVVKDILTKIRDS
jgi:hypothetical protein